MAALPEEIIKQNKMASTSKDLPEEIITQILYNVPAKSIGRFRSVSKGWLSLLTHPDFIKTHDQNTLIHKHRLIFTTTESNINHPAVYSNSYDAPVLKPSDLHETYPDLIICGSCNGLVLVSYRNIDSASTFVLLNPTTKESMQLPEHRSYTYPRACRLGYDSDTGDFKCVFLSYPRSIPIGAMNVNIYSLKTNTWRRFEFFYVYNVRGSNRKGAFVNGFLHWIAEKTVNGFRLTLILAFSLADEEFSEVPTPEFVENTDILSMSYCQLVVLGGKLALFREKKGEIWLMNEYRVKESWTKISLHGFPTAMPDGDDKPMVFHHDGKFMVAKKDRMLVFDDEKETFEETVCVWDPEDFRVAGSYVESLISIALCIEQ